MVKKPASYPLYMYLHAGFLTWEFLEQKALGMVCMADVCDGYLWFFGSWQKGFLGSADLVWFLPRKNTFPKDWLRIIDETVDCHADSTDHFHGCEVHHHEGGVYTE